MPVSPRKQASTTIGGRYLPFLPKDNKTWQADEVVRSINDDLAQLLSLPAEDFWATVRNDQSLHVCLDTYLRYKRRVYDDFGEEVEGASATSQQLARRVFMVLLRMVTPRERDPGGPPRDQQAQLLYDMWLLDVPKLMDVAVLYSTHNPELTRKFLSQVFELQPRYSSDLAASAPLLVGNLAEVVERCSTAGDRALRVGYAAAAAHVKELRDAVDYLRDASMTLTAFVACYSPAAVALLQPDHGALLCTLASAHDRLLPQLARVFSQPAAVGAEVAVGKAADAGGGSGADAMLRKLAQVAVGLRRLGYLMLLYGSCGAASPGGRREPKPMPQAAETRGNELMMLLMAVSSAGVAAGTGGGSDSGGASYLGLIARDHNLDEQVATAVLEGTIALDDAQFDYLLALIGGDPRVMDRVQNHRRQTCAAGTFISSAAALSSGAGPSGSSGGAPSGSGAGPSGPAAAARRASLINQIKDLLPDYGDGFLAACLEAFDNNSERVINMLLEDNLPPHLDKLDRKLASGGAQAAAQAGAGPSGSGSGPAGPPDALTAMSSWNSLAGLASTSAAAGPGPAAAAAAAVPSARPALGSGAGFWRTAGPGGGGGGPLHRGTLKVLDRMDKEVKALTSRLGDELQWEYDDEYDDSFDDLAAGGADGVADAEGDDEDGGFGRRAIATSRGAGGVGPGLSRLGGGGGPGKGGLAASGGAAEYDDEPNDASYSNRGLVGASSAYRTAPGRGEPSAGAASGAASAGSRGTGKPPPTAAAATAAAAAAVAAAAAAGRKPDAAPFRAPTIMGQAAPGAAAGGRGGGRAGGAGPAGGRGGRGGRGNGGGERLWVLDGRIYNYAKEGAQLVNSRQEADAVLDAARQAALAIHGLGPGGNKGLMRQQQLQQQVDGSDGSGDEGRGQPGLQSRPEGGAGGRGGGGGGRGGGGGGGGGGDGDRRQHDRKEKNKAAVANHHRKDRALRKQGLL